MVGGVTSGEWRVVGGVTGGEWRVGSRETGGLSITLVGS